MDISWQERKRREKKIKKQQHTNTNRIKSDVERIENGFTRCCSLLLFFALFKNLNLFSHFPFIIIRRCCWCCCCCWCLLLLLFIWLFLRNKENKYSKYCEHEIWMEISCVHVSCTIVCHRSDIPTTTYVAAVAAAVFLFQPAIQFENRHTQTTSPSTLFSCLLKFLYRCASLYIFFHHFIDFCFSCCYCLNSFEEAVYFIGLVGIGRCLRVTEYTQRYFEFV